YAAKIFQGQKTVELRRKFPQNGVVGGLALFYSSSPVRAVVGFAQIKQVLKLPVSRIWHEYGVAACISRDDFNNNYFTNLPCGFVIRFSGFKSLDQEVKARELED